MPSFEELGVDLAAEGSGDHTAIHKHVDYDTVLFARRDNATGEMVGDTELFVKLKELSLPGKDSKEA